MSVFLLTTAERLRFIEWLDWQADSNKGLIEQWEKLGGDQPHIEAVAKKLRAEEMAYRIVSSILRTTEEMSIG